MNIKLKLCYVFLSFQIVLLFGSTDGAVNSFEKKGRGGKSPCPLNDLHDISNAFAVNITTRIIDENPNQNVFIAPTSISMALSLLLIGAKGKTKDELDNALGYSRVNRKRHYLCHLREWKKKVSSPELTLGTASRLYTDNSVSLEPDFVRRVGQNDFASDNEKVDFTKQPEEARDSINQWVAKQTAGHIDQLFPPGSISSQTKLALTSAIYFQGFWEEGFDDETFTEPFYFPDNSQTDVKYMYKNAMQLRFLEDVDGIDFIELPYKQVEGGYDISMIAFKANQYSRMNLKQVEKKLGSNKYTSAAIDRLHSSQKRTVDVKLPVITIKEEYDLKSTLVDMGMRSLFTPGVADLSGIDGSKNLYLDQAVHKTYFKMDQKGVEAAGATGLKILPMSMSPSFFATQPFYIFIYDHDTKSILFSGKIYDPSSLA